MKIRTLIFQYKELVFDLFFLPFFAQCILNIYASYFKAFIFSRVCTLRYRKLVGIHDLHAAKALLKILIWVIKMVISQSPLRFKMSFWILSPWMNIYANYKTVTNVGYIYLIVQFDKYVVLQKSPIWYLKWDCNRLFFGKLT